MPKNRFKNTSLNRVVPFGMNLEHTYTDIFHFLNFLTMMTTLSGVLEKLRMRKQDNEYQIAENQFRAPSGKLYCAEDLTIIKTYRFEGESSDPGDSAVLYLIEANDGLIGYSIDAYGAYSNHEGNAYDEFIRKINVIERDEQEIFV